MNKAMCERIHFKKRAMCRFGLDMPRQAMDTIISRIQNNDKTVSFVEKQSVRRSVFDITIDGYIYRVIYDRQRKTLITILPGRTPCS